MNNKIWLSSPHMGGKEQEYIKQAFDTNWIAPLGPNVVGFEQDLENYIKGENHVAALSSGTAALHLALIQLGVQQNDVVICQSMTFSASANPIVYQGATPVFIDSESETWNICPKALEEAINFYLNKNCKPKAIIAVHLYGMPFKVDEVVSIAKKYDIPLIEDAAEALGSTFNGQACGTFGEFGVLSFNGNKIITTSGGGALVCKSQKAKSNTVFLATQARDEAPHYQHSHIGYNYRMSNICAGIGRGQMEVLTDHIGLRRKMNAFYASLFENTPEVKLFTETSDVFFSNHWLSAILLKDYETREALRLHLEKNNIESRPLWKPMHMQPVFEQYNYFGDKIAEQLFELGLCLPSGSNLTENEKDRIKEAIISFFKS